MGRSLGRCPICGSRLFHRCCGCHLRDRCAWREATYTRTGTAVPFIISELPGERAEALFIAMAALVPTAGEHSEISILTRSTHPSPRVTLTYFGRRTP